MLTVTRPGCLAGLFFAQPPATGDQAHPPWHLAATRNTRVETDGSTDYTIISIVNILRGIELDKGYPHENRQFRPKKQYWVWQKQDERKNDRVLWRPEEFWRFPISFGYFRSAELLFFRALFSFAHSRFWPKIIQGISLAKYLSKYLGK